MNSKVAQIKVISNKSFNDYLLVFEVLEGKGDLVLSLLVEDDVEATGVIVDLENSAHRFFLLADDAANNDNLEQSRERVSFCIK